MFIFGNAPLHIQQALNSSMDGRSIESIRKTQNPDRFDQHDFRQEYTACGKSRPPEIKRALRLYRIILDQQTHGDIGVNRQHYAVLL